MKLMKILSVLFVLMFFINYCMGPKVLTQEEYGQLSPQERVTYLEKQINKSPGDISLKKMLYNEFLDLEMPERALAVMEQLIEQDPYQADVQFEYGELLMKNGNKQAAYRAFVNSLQSPGGNRYTAQIGRYLGGKYSIRQITNNSENETFPAFSPDGLKIAYQIYRNGNWDIVQKNLNGEGEVTLVNSPADEELPCYGPDGINLVFTTNIDDKRPINSKYKVREIYLKDLKNGYEKNVTESIADDWLPRFSSDGKSIVFVTERSDLRNVPYTEKQSDVYLMESNGDFHTRLTDTESNDGGACFAFDNQQIFFHSNRHGTYDIFSMKKTGELPMLIIGNANANEVQPFASPDSQHIVYFSDENGNYDLFMANSDGSGIEQLTFSPSDDTNPVFSPDGKSIAFHSDRNGNFDIFILDLEQEKESSSQDLVMKLNSLIGQP